LLGRIAFRGNHLVSKRKGEKPYFKWEGGKGKVEKGTFNTGGCGG